MKANFKKDPTYYVITKDVYIYTTMQESKFASDPVEILTNKTKFHEHLADLRSIEGRLSDIVKDSNPTYSEVSVQFRGSVITPDMNQTIVNLIEASKEEENGRTGEEVSAGT